MARCNGLFAFAAFDSARRRVLLARDRFGVKPLYLRAPRRGACGSPREVGALLAAGVAGAARPDVLAHAVGYGWAEGAQTPFAGIDRLAPGTLLDDRPRNPGRDRAPLVRPGGRGRPGAHGGARRRRPR